MIEIKRCNNCGKELTGRQTKYCSDKCRHQAFDKTEKRKQYRKAYNHWRRTTVKGRYDHYKSSAKEKGLEFSISIEDFEDWLLTSCTYCGFEGVVGLDRIDNDKGYTQHNVVPCCSLCNKTRSNNFTREEFRIIGLAIKKIREMRDEV